MVMCDDFVLCCCATRAGKAILCAFRAEKRYYFCGDVYLLFVVVLYFVGQMPLSLGHWDKNHPSGTIWQLCVIMLSISRATHSREG